MTDTKRGRSTSKSAGSGGGDIAAVGRETVENEIGGLRSLLAGIGKDFERAVRLVLECRGKTIVCGIGKSGIVARKIAATLSSTGTPSVYLHPVEAMHGDMGMVTADDVFLAVSKSGNNEEITRLLPHIRSLDVKMISITAAANAVLARESDVALLTHVDREACPMDIVPTTSTTAAMVLGDALAVAVFRLRDFSEEDFAKLHPSGVLGKRLILTVAELMHAGDDMPLVSMETTLKEALFVIAGKRLGCAGVADPEGRLAGIVTDGDLKRILMKNPAALEEPVGGLMTPGPRTTTAGTLAVEALRDMELGGSGPVTQLFVLDATGRPVGVIHIHDIVRAGLR